MVVMMKMTSSTKARSSNGVMFNSVNDACADFEHFFIGQMAGVFSPISERVSAMAILSSRSRLST